MILIHRSVSKPRQNKALFMFMSMLNTGAADWFSFFDFEEVIGTRWPTRFISMNDTTAYLCLDIQIDTRLYYTEADFRPGLVWAEHKNWLDLHVVIDHWLFIPPGILFFVDIWYVALQTLA